MSEQKMREDFEAWYSKSFARDCTAEHRIQRGFAWVAWKAALSQREAQELTGEEMKSAYDVGSEAAIASGTESLAHYSGLRAVIAADRAKRGNK